MKKFKNNNEYGCKVAYENELETSLVLDFGSQSKQLTYPCISKEAFATAWCVAKLKTLMKFVLKRFIGRTMGTLIPPVEPSKEEEVSPDLFKSDQGLSS